MAKKAETLTLQNLYVDHLKDLYSAENQITKALPKVIKTVKEPKLKKALEDHLQETMNQIQRIEQIFESNYGSPRGKKCVGMEGVLEEGSEAMAKEMSSPDLMDSALIGGCKKVEHYEICAYEAVRDYAQLLGDEKAVRLLNQTLEEEKAADEKLSELGMQIITPETVQAAATMEAM